MTSENRTYLLGGIPATELVQQFGAPLYVYDSAVISKQYHRLKNAFRALPSWRANVAGHCG